jgi:hypothetical protein
MKRNFKAIWVDFLKLVPTEKMRQMIYILVGKVFQLTATLFFKMVIKWLILQLEGIIKGFLDK